MAKFNVGDLVKVDMDELPKIYGIIAKVLSDGYKVKHFAGSISFVKWTEQELLPTTEIEKALYL